MTSASSSSHSSKQKDATDSEDHSDNQKIDKDGESSDYESQEDGTASNDTDDSYRESEGKQSSEESSESDNHDSGSEDKSDAARKPPLTQSQCLATDSETAHTHRGPELGSKGVHWVREGVAQHSEASTPAMASTSSTKTRKKPQKLLKGAGTDKDHFTVTENGATLSSVNGLVLSSPRKWTDPKVKLCLTALALMAYDKKQWTAPVHDPKQHQSIIQSLLCPPAECVQIRSDRGLGGYVYHAEE